MSLKPFNFEDIIEQETEDSRDEVAGVNTQLETEAELVDSESDLPNEVHAALFQAGLTSDPPKIAGKLEGSKIENARKVFNKSGAGLKESAQTIAEIMADSKNRHSQLKAAEVALKVQGILDDIDEKHIPQINIQINNFEGSSAKTLVNLVLPQ